ncbi:dTDP-4-amino-4,6-dideoxygalactose transaminase [Cohnella sp. 56]|uniref:dTDP-4-amino-4,6-dideoxygalactose transaminase n=1 Tax=Cohnella sp. 56 TaxID=3113722 RepID=UPI0030EADFC2
MIPFNRPSSSELELQFIRDSFERGHLSGDGWYTKKCSEYLEQKLGVSKVLLTTSCTSALEMAAILLDIREGDEVIMPSYTFVSTANAFALRGAHIVFVDIRKDTMNIDESLIEAAITERTKAIVPVHYAGVSCNMTRIMEIARAYDLFVVEDAAQGIFSAYDGMPLGSIGDIGCLSFHETKNISSGEGGALLLNNPAFIERAEIIREKGTNRANFFRGQVDKYSWVDIGSSFLLSDLNAAVLYAQLLRSDELNEKRLRIWNLYREGLSNIAAQGMVELASIPADCRHNAHMFYLKLRDLDTRARLISYLNKRHINAVFHYVPLHSSVAGSRYGRFYGEDRYTTSESERLLRLPLFYDLSEQQAGLVVEAVGNFFLQ